jgi:carbon-monoxide dehydrogenase medium subunit
VIPAPFDYVRADSVEGALAGLADDGARPLAGGQSLIPLLRLRLAAPAKLVDIGGLEELRGSRRRDGGLALGALVTWDELETEAGAPTALRDCAAGVGDLQVRNLGTVGGSVAHADPSADLPAVLVALRARMGLRSRDGAREVEAGEFFQGPFTTACREDELVAEVIVPALPAGSGSAYVAFEHPASGFALAGAAAVVLPDGSARLALTGLADRPVPVASEQAIEEALGAVREDAHLRQLARVVAGRALARAREETR